MKSEKSLTSTGSNFRKDRRQNAADLWAEQQDIKAVIRAAADAEVKGLDAQVANRARPGWMAKKKAVMWKAYKKENPDGADEWEEHTTTLARTEATTLKDNIIRFVDAVIYPVC